MLRRPCLSCFKPIPTPCVSEMRASLFPASSVLLVHCLSSSSVSARLPSPHPLPVSLSPVPSLSSNCVSFCKYRDEKMHSTLFGSKFCPLNLGPAVFLLHSAPSVLLFPLPFQISSISPRCCCVLPLVLFLLTASSPVCWLPYPPSALMLP